MHQEVDEDVADGLKVVAATLFAALVRIVTAVPHRTRHGRSHLESDMLSRLRILETLGQPEVNDVQRVKLLTAPDQEILRLNVSMDVVRGVHRLYSLDHLRADPKNCLDIKLVFAEFKEVLKTRALYIHYHNVEVALDASPV